MKVVTLILAGGDGRRMHGSKPLRLLGGRTLLQRTLEYAKQLGNPVALSLRSRDQISGFDDIPCVEDRRDIEGPLAGVAAGLQWAERQQFDALLTIPVDMPWLPPDLTRRLLRKGKGQPAFAASGGRAHSVCALWPIATSDAVERYISAGNRSLRGILGVLSAEAVEWQFTGLDPFANLNDLEALAEAERMLQKST